MKAADLFPYRHEVRTGTLRAVLHLPQEHMEWKPPGGIHTILGWLRHIAQTEDWWVQSAVFGREDFRPPSIAMLSEKGEVLDYLAETRLTTEGLLQTWEADALKETRAVPSGYRGPVPGSQVTLHWIVDHIYNHERHHRGQISLYLRLMGIQPPAYV